MTTALLVLVVLMLAGIGAGIWDTRRRILNPAPIVAQAPDLSPALHRIEELHQRLSGLGTIELRLTGLDRSVALLPEALDAVRSGIKLAFEKFEEGILPDDSKQVGSQALSRVARARADMERLSDQSLADFNAAVERKDRRANEPIVVRGAL
jgi:hypothetical protein